MGDSYVIIDNPEPGRRFASPVEKSGYWKVPPGCYRVVVARATGYPITHMMRSRVEQERHRQISLQMGSARS